VPALAVTSHDEGKGAQMADEFKFKFKSRVYSSTVYSTYTDVYQLASFVRYILNVADRP
jgi:hypothetical protein